MSTSVGGEIQSLAWDPRGERLAVLLKGASHFPSIHPASVVWFYLLIFIFLCSLRWSTSSRPTCCYSCVQDKNQPHFWAFAMVCTLCAHFIIMCLYYDLKCISFPMVVLLYSICRLGVLNISCVSLFSGFVQGEPGAEPRLMQFHPNFQHGALLTVVSLYLQIPVSLISCFWRVFAVLEYVFHT